MVKMGQQIIARASVPTTYAPAVILLCIQMKNHKATTTRTKAMGRHRSLVILLLLLPQHYFGHGFVIDLGLSSSSSSRSSSSSLTVAPSRPLVVGPDPATKPDYDNITGPLGAAVDQVLLRLFHASLYEQVRGVPYLDGSTSSTPPVTFDDIAALAREMNQTEPPAVVQQKALATLRSLFPSWLPRQYQILFSRPFPAFSARMNAWATYVAGTWLMGECRVVDVQVEGSSSTATIRPQQGLHVTRCRFLESAHCASVCVNACKIPTQTFFRDDMGIDLLMEPNYETYECTFSFGTQPTIATELAALQTPCLAACPAVSRQRHPTMAFTATVVETGLCDMVSSADDATARAA